MRDGEAGYMTRAFIYIFLFLPLLLIARIKELDRCIMTPAFQVRINELTLGDHFVI
jgi:hypothetical protein